MGVIWWDKLGGLGGPQARRRSRRHGRSPCVSTQSKRPAAVRLRFAEICGGLLRGTFVKKFVSACGGGVKKIVVTFGGGGLLDIIVCTPTRRGRSWHSL